MPSRVLALLASCLLLQACEFGLPAGDRYVDHCHLCYLVRREQLDRFPDQLCPRGVYGEE